MWANGKLSEVLVGAHITLPSGETYVGEWKDGKRHGHGTYTWPASGTYVGEWRDGKMHGEGIHLAN
jgi:hypothetical protein